MTTATHVYTPYTPPAPASALCPVCSLDRAAAMAEGMALVAIPQAERTVEQRQQIGLLLSLMNSCERVCASAGGWR